MRFAMNNKAETKKRSNERTKKMMALTRAALVVVLALLNTTNVFAFDIVVGSHADQPLDVSTNMEIQLPNDGILHFTTITVRAGATLTFRKNPLNTPVYLLATGDVLIENTGVIDVSGKNGSASPPAPGEGGPGGFNGGSTAGVGSTPSNGHGPGGGKGGNCSDNGARAGAGGYGIKGYRNQLVDGAVYGGPLLIPLVGGSGGGGYDCGGSSNEIGGGGGGGGAILIASNSSITVNGKINALGGLGRAQLNPMNQGSGGAIRLVAPVLAGASTGLFGPTPIRWTVLLRRLP